MPKNYKSIITLSKLQGNDYILIQTDYDLKSVLEFIGLPKKYRSHITGAIVLIWEGDYSGVWLSESPRYYSLYSWYHPLPFYRPKHWTKKHLPIYWIENNIEYCK